jgi:hypothetical protein
MHAQTLLRLLGFASQKGQINFFSQLLSSLSAKFQKRVLNLNLHIFSLLLKSYFFFTFPTDRNTEKKKNEKFEKCRAKKFFLLRRSPTAADDDEKSRTCMK